MNLQVSDDIWDTMTPFQKFLWYADEMEHRWHTLTSRYKNGTTYYELTWSHPRELEEGIDNLRTIYGCDPIEVTNNKVHTVHIAGTWNCTDLIRQDLEYRTMMRYDVETTDVLVSPKFPQHIGMSDCMESRAELEEAIKTYSVDWDFDMETWVY